MAESRSSVKSPRREHPPRQMPFGQQEPIVQRMFHHPHARRHQPRDNLNLHRRKSLTDSFGGEAGGEAGNCFTVHFSPTHGSWLIMPKSKSAYWRYNFQLILMPARPVQRFRARVSRCSVSRPGSFGCQGIVRL
jgi:hypothetical protein